MMENNVSVEKFIFEHKDKKVGVIEVPVEIRRMGAHLVVVMTRVKKDEFKLELNVAAVALDIYKQRLSNQNFKRIKWVMFMPNWVDGEGISFLIQPGAYGSGIMEAFSLGGGMLAENAIPMPRDGSKCTETILVGKGYGKSLNA